jgi:glyceraldehyde-3-phosphate dehydrogenase (NADP+)
LARSPYGQQASVFTQDARSAAQLIDVLANTVCRININTQCGRSPDNVPFTGRRSSALGTMSVKDALEAFTVKVVLAAKQDQVNEKVIKGFECESKFLQPLTEGQSLGQGGGDQKAQTAK